MVSQRFDGNDPKRPTSQTTPGAKSEARNASAAAGEVAFRPLPRGRRKKAQPVDATASRQPTSGAERATTSAGNGATEQPATAAEPVASGATTDDHTMAATPATDPASGAVVQLQPRGETAQLRVDRLKREINRLADQHADLGGRVARLAIACEAGDDAARAQRRDLRVQIGEIVDAIADKKAALAAAEPIAEAERQRETRARRGIAFDRARAYAAWQLELAGYVDRCIDAAIAGFRRMREAESAVMASTQRHVPAASHWLLEMDAKTLENVLIARMVRAGLFDASEFDPGPGFTGADTLASTIRQHVESVTARLDDIEHRDPADPAPEQPKLPWETAGGKPWRSVIEPVITDTAPTTAA